MKTDFQSMPLEELVANALFKLGEIEDAVRASDVIARASDRSTVLRTLAGLDGGRALGAGARDLLASLLGQLEAERDTETLDRFQVFVDRDDPEEGAVGSVETRRVLTDRGQRVEQCLVQTRLLVHLLRVADARIASERLVNRHMGF